MRYVFKKMLSEKFLNYNFKGKAYCEDIFFSIQQKSKGYKHVICNKSIAIGEVDNTKIKFKDFCKEISVRKYLIEVHKWKYNKILYLGLFWSIFYSF